MENDSPSTPKFQRVAKLVQESPKTPTNRRITVQVPNAPKRSETVCSSKSFLRKTTNAIDNEPIRSTSVRGGKLFKSPSVDSFEKSWQRSNKPNIVVNGTAQSPEWIEYSSLLGLDKVSHELENDSLSTPKKSQNISKFIQESPKTPTDRKIKVEVPNAPKHSVTVNSLKTFLRKTTNDINGDDKSTMRNLFKSPSMSLLNESKEVETSMPRTEKLETFANYRDTVQSREWLEHRSSLNDANHELENDAYLSDVSLTKENKTAITSRLDKNAIDTFQKLSIKETNDSINPSFKKKSANRLSRLKSNF